MPLVTRTADIVNYPIGAPPHSALANRERVLDDANSLEACF
jgi:hypothetical protein